MRSILDLDGLKEIQRKKNILCPACYVYFVNEILFKTQSLLFEDFEGEHLLGLIG